LEGGIEMREGMQFVIGLTVGLFIWKFYDLIHMAISDGLKMFGIVDPYTQAIVVLAVLGIVIFVVIHGGARIVMNKVGV
jgi:hypothetical protein